MEIVTGPAGAEGGPAPRRVLWDRKADGGFPDVKELKRRVRDVVEPDRNLGHVDRHHGGGATKGEVPGEDEAARGSRRAVAGEEEAAPAAAVSGRETTTAPAATAAEEPGISCLPAGAVCEDCK